MTTNPIIFYSLTLSPFVGGSSSLRTGANCYAVCTLGWVNLYQKLEIEKNKGCGKVTLIKQNNKEI